MDENMESVETTAVPVRNVPVKWLRVLFYIHIASIVVSLISFLPIADNWLTWVGRAITAGCIVCLFQLAPAHDRYQKAAIFMAVYLGGTLVTALLTNSSILSLAASICSLLALYQEYSAHSDLVAELDPKLSRKWHSLFNWSIAAGVLLALGSVIAVLVVVFLEINTVIATTVIVGILSVPDLIIQLIYLKYLNRTADLLEDQ